MLFDSARSKLISLMPSDNRARKRWPAISHPALQRVLLFAGKVGRPKHNDHRHGPEYEQRVYGRSDKPSSTTGGGPEIVTTVEQSDHQDAPACTVVQPREHYGHRQEAVRGQRQHREAQLHVGAVVEEPGQVPAYPEQGDDEGGRQSAHVALQLRQSVPTPTALFSDPGGEYPENPPGPSQVGQVGYSPEPAQVRRRVSQANDYADRDPIHHQRREGGNQYPSQPDAPPYHPPKQLPKALGSVGDTRSNERGQ